MAPRVSKRSQECVSFFAGETTLKGTENLQKISPRTEKGAAPVLAEAEFTQWYGGSRYFDEKRAEHQQQQKEVEGIDVSYPHDGSFSEKATWCLLAPLTLTLFYTLPDVHWPGNESKCYRCMGVSIAWIMVY